MKVVVSQPDPEMVVLKFSCSFKIKGSERITKGGCPIEDPQEKNLSWARENWEQPLVGLCRDLLRLEVLWVYVHRKSIDIAFRAPFSAWQHPKVAKVIVAALRKHYPEAEIKLPVS